MDIALRFVCCLADLEFGIMRSELRGGACCWRCRSQPALAVETPTMPSERGQVGAGGAGEQGPPHHLLAPAGEREIEAERNADFCR